MIFFFLLFLFLVVLSLNLIPHQKAGLRYRRFYKMVKEQAPGELLQRLYHNPSLELVEPKYQPMCQHIKGFHEGNVCRNNSVTMITTGAQFYESMMRDLESARESILLEYYHFGVDKGSQDVRNVLIRKAQEGVKVMFLNENMGNFPHPHRKYSDMKRYGVEVIRFSPLFPYVFGFLSHLNYRNHRKIMVIDGKIGYTGGMNVNDKYFHRWRDTHFRVEGDVVASLQLNFLSTWVSCGGKLGKDLSFFFPAPQPQKEDMLVQFVADEPGLRFHPIEASYVWALDHATEYVYIQTPYFAPTPPVLKALKGAGERGVDVRIIFPDEPDHHFIKLGNESYFKGLLSSGVKIYMRKGTFNHSKTLVSDNYLTILGSANVDYRSFYYNYEGNAYLYNRSFALHNKEIFVKELDLCYPMSLETVLSWDSGHRAKQRLVRILTIGL